MTLGQFNHQASPGQPGITPITAAGLVALPFNALARRSGWAQADQLWQQTKEMMAEEDSEYSTLSCPESLRGFYNDRFYQNDWLLARIVRQRASFARHETRQLIETSTHGRVCQRGWLASTTDGELVGEFHIWHGQHNKALAQGLDLLRPSARGQGYGAPLFELKLRTAAALGYNRYRASVAHNNKRSMQRLSALAEQGLAERSHDFWKNGRNCGRTYFIDLTPFK